MAGDITCIHEARPIIAKPNVGFSLIKEDVIKRDMLGVLHFEETISTRKDWQMQGLSEAVYINCYPEVFK